MVWNETEYPCPNCQTKLLLDPTTDTVACPECDYQETLEEYLEEHGGE